MSGEPLLAAPTSVKQGTLVEGRARRKSVSAAPSRPSATRLSPQLVLYALSRWWFYALPLGIALGVIGAVATSYLMPRTYRASAWLQIESERQVLAYDLPESRTFVRTQLALIKSPLVLTDVLSNPEIAELPEIQESSFPRKMLEKGLSIQAVDGSDLYQLNFDTPHQAHAAMIADAVVESYFHQKDKVIDERTQTIIRTLNEQLEFHQTQITELRKDLRSMASDENGTLPMSADDENLFLNIQGPLAELHSRLSVVEAELQWLNARLKAANEQSADGSGQLTEAEVTTLIDSDATLQRHFAKLGELETSIQLARQVNGWGKDHPRLQQMMAEQEGVRTSIAQRRKAVELRVHEELRARKSSTANELRQQIAAQEALRDSLQQKLSTEQERLAASDDDSMQLAIKRLELQRAEEVYNLIASRVSAMSTEQNAPGRVLLLKDASENDVVVYSEPLPKIAASLMIGFLAPFALAVFAEFRMQRITHGDQLEKESALPVIAEISRIPLQTTRQANSDRFAVSQALFEESIDQLRTSLMVPDDMKTLQVLATVSAVSGEGKSSIASQLAMSLARATHEPVLLIDGDTRSPSQQDIFQLPLAPGVVDILQNRCSLSEATQEWSELVYVVPAGDLDMNPHALITPSGFRKLVDEARPHYRYIIIDCPPVLAASEAFVLAKSADAAVLCAMRDVSRSHQVKKACGRLQSIGVRTLGVILSGVPTFDYRYRYGSYYYGHGQHRASHARASHGYASVNGNGEDSDGHVKKRPVAK